MNNSTITKFYVKFVNVNWIIKLMDTCKKYKCE